MRGITLALVIGLLLSAGLAVDVQAKKGDRDKPPKSPTATATPEGGGCADNGGGTIYYVDDSAVVRAMDADCGTETELTNVTRFALRSSNALHNDKRWFLTEEINRQMPTYPNGKHPAELWAHDEDGASVQITDYTKGGTILSEVWVAGGGLQWAHDDSFVSWVAGHWVDDDNDGTFDRLDSIGIYRADVVYDGNGGVTGLASPLPILPTVVVQDGSGFPYHRHTWSPDGAKVVYSNNYDLFRVDSVPSGNPTTHTFIETGDIPDWSATDKILYDDGNTLYSINPDGTGRSRIVSDRKKGVGFPWWSPTGSHLVYLGNNISDTYRITASGREKTKIADGQAIGWVAAP